MRWLAMLLVATSLSADNRVSLHPVGPTSIDPIAVHILVSCGVTNQNVQRVETSIKVTLTIDGICDPPLPFVHEVKLDPLPPGEYHLDVQLAGVAGTYGSTDFVVRNGGDVPFTVHPFAVRESISGLRMRIEPKAGEEICPNGDCGVISIRIDNTPVADIRSDGVAATFDMPKAAVGLHDVTLKHADVTRTATAAIYVFGDEADPSIFERILWPVLDSPDGANGSHWVSEAILTNPRPWFIDNYNSVIPAFCVVSPCTERLSPRLYTSFDGEFYPHGVALLASRTDAPDLGFSLRVRDTSRESEGFGTEVPVVREKDMFRDRTMTLLGVPRDPRYRVKVRMYAFEPFFNTTTQDWRVIVVNPDGTRTDQSLISERQCSPLCPGEPSYLELDLPNVTKTGTSSIYITPPAESFAWAFASVTNNVTQQVTIVTPNGEGGQP